MSKKTAYYSKSITFLFLSTLINSLILFASKILIARNSTFDLYGYFSIIFSESQSLSIIMALGLFTIVRIELPRINKEEKYSLLTSSLIYIAIFSIISLIVSPTIYFLTTDTTYGYSFLLCAIINFFMLFQAVFVGLQKFFYYFLMSSIQSLSFFILVVSTYKNLNIKLLTLFLIISYIIGVVISVLLLAFKHKGSFKELIKIKNYKLKIFNFNKQRFYLIVVLLVNTLSSYLVLKIPQLMGFIEESAYLSIARGIAILLMMLPNVIGMSIGPLISKGYSTERLDQINKTLKEGFSIIYLLHGLSVIVFAYFGDFALYILYEERYLEQSLGLFYIFLVAMLIEGLVKISSSFLLNSKKENIYAIGRGASLLAFVVVELILLYTIKISSITVSIAYCATNIVQLGVFYYFIVKDNEYYQKTDLKNILVWTFAVFVSVFLGVYFSAILQISYLIKLGILAANLLLFLVCLRLTRIIYYKEIFGFIKETVLHRFRNKSTNEKNAISTEN